MTAYLSRPGLVFQTAGDGNSISSNHSVGAVVDTGSGAGHPLSTAGP